jgi:hypothetical protein
MRLQQVSFFREAWPREYELAGEKTRRRRQGLADATRALGHG